MPDRLEDGADVSCHGCGRVLCSWGTLRRQVAHALEEEPAWRRARTAASPDPLPPPRPGGPGDRRLSHRHVVSGTAVIAGGLEALACALRDLSRDGACLFLPGGQPLPESFTLQVSPETPPRPARLVRRRLDEVGVAFMEG